MILGLNWFYSQRKMRELPLTCNVKLVNEVFAKNPNLYKFAIELQICTSYLTFSE